MRASTWGWIAMNKQPVSYLQTDKRWKDKAWNGMTIGKAGCGPTSAAMLISTLTGKEVTPEETYAWAGANGHLEKGHGTNYVTYFQKQFAEYGLKAEMLNWQNTYGKPDHPNHDKVVEKLKEGYYAIALMNKGLWTSSGHFVVIWWQDGKVRINDPASTRAERLNGDIQTFRSQVKYYWLVDARAYNKEEISVEDKTPEKVTDSIPSDWAKEAVEWATTNGLMFGDGSGDLMLHSPITREQFCVMLKRYHDMRENLV